jgi:hypothetical protein
LAIGAIVAVVGGAVESIRRARVRSAARQRMAGAQAVLADNTVVTLTGTVRSNGKLLTAPLSGTPCVLHRSTIRMFQGKRRRRMLVAERTRCEMVPFELETRGGKVIVVGDRADVTIRPGPIIPRQLDRDRAFMRGLGLDGDIRSAGFDEVVIEPGMTVAVYGVARFEATPDVGESGFRDEVRTVRLAGDDQHPLTIGPPGV